MHTTLVPADPNVTPQRYSRFWFRFLEILPGACAWTALITPFILSIYFPLQVTLFIIVFDVYWLQKSFYTAYMLPVGFRRMQKNLKTDWTAALAELHSLSAADREKFDILDPDDLYQAVILATYKEELAILESSVQSLADSKWEHKRLIIVLATEGRDAENARHNAAVLREKFGTLFYKFIVTEHPDGVVGEVRGKGANVTFAAKELVKQVTEAGIPLNRVIVSTADADTRFIPVYLPCLAYKYAITKDRVKASYQPIAAFLNNVWEAGMMSRVMAFSTTFWHLAESVTDYRLLTFSTHAMSLQTLVDIHYWCTSVVNEDSRQYFRSYFHYEGKFRAIPLFMPVNMDAVHVDSVVQTYKNLYFQQQRWAYGVEHFPYIVLESLRHRRIPWLNRAMLVWRAWNGSFSWATNAFFITVVGWLPILLNNSFKDQVIASNFPLVTRSLLTVTWIGIVVSYVIGLQLLPPWPKEGRIKLIIATFLQWILVPVTTTVFGAFPGIDSQTRLMFGRYLGFRVTDKQASKPVKV